MKPCWASNRPSSNRWARLFKSLRGISGSSILGSGEVALMLDEFARRTGHEQEWDLWTHLRVQWCSTNRLAHKGRGNVCLLSRLRLSQKFAILGAMALIMVAVPARTFFRDVAAQLAFVQRDTSALPCKAQSVGAVHASPSGHFRRGIGWQSGIGSQTSSHNYQRQRKN